MSPEMNAQQVTGINFAGSAPKGLTITRRFTRDGHDPFATVEYETRTCELRNPAGAIIFKNDAIEVPKFWSQAATDVLAELYFRKTGVPLKNPDGTQKMTAEHTFALGEETSIKQIVHRIVGCWRWWGETHNYFASPKDADAFYDELVYMMLHQMVAPSAKQWIATGLQWAYGINGLVATVQTAPATIIDIDHPDVETTNGSAVRITHAFVEALTEDREWSLRSSADGHVVKTLQARSLWDSIARAAWQATEPGLQFDTTINEWHTCPKSGRINNANLHSAFMFLDNTDCVEATMNLGYFFDAKTMVFDVDSFKYTTRLWTIVLEISALMMHAGNEFRALGLGVANLGAGVLMAAGVPYDSREARAIAAAITAIMTGEAYAASAEMAKYLGAFAKFDLNRSDMLRTIRNHRRAAYNAPAEEYEKLFTKPAGIDPRDCPVYLLRAARTAWDRALELGEIYGYRNAQVTMVAASAGKTHIAMDCATAGIEPDSALMKFKKSANGRYTKLVSDSVPTALRILGYSASQIDDVLRHMRGAGTLAGAPHINHASLKAKGFTDEDIRKIEIQLPSVFELQFAFNVWTLGEELMLKLGFSPHVFKEVDFNMLAALGFSAEQLVEANEYVCGTMSIEGAPFIKAEHYAVFDCAAKCGKKGERQIVPAGHLRMMAAVQPFLSGAIAKQTPISRSASIDEVKDVYMEACRMGLKSVVLAPHARKRTEAVVPAKVVAPPVVPTPPAVVVQPPPVPEIHEPIITMTVPENLDHEHVHAHQPNPQHQHQAPAHAELLSPPSVGASHGLQFGQRRALPAKRSGITVEAKVGNQQVYLRTGEYPDGTLGEIFIDMYREGAAFRSVLNCFAISISIGLQHGVPLDKFVEKFTYTRFEPSGFTTHPNVKMCTSIVDYVFRVLAVEYLGRTDLAQVPPEGIEMNRATKLREVIQAAADHAMEQEPGLPPGMYAAEQPTLIPPQQIEDLAQPPIPPTSTATANRFPESEMILGDAPPCDVCGHTTVRNGMCYRCLNCGAQNGCN